jgi:flagellin
MSNVRAVNTNLSSLYALENLRKNTERVSQASNRLATGKKIVTAADDVSGYSIARTISSQVKRSEQALSNLQDAQSLLQVADGSLSTVTESLQRVRELLVGLSSDSNSIEQRTSFAKEIRAQLEEVDRLSQASDFNGIKLLDGSTTSALFQIGINSNVAVNTLDVSSALTSTRILDLNLITTGTNASTFITSLNDIFDGTTTQLNSSDRAYLYLKDVDLALTRITGQRTSVGAFQKRLESTANDLSSQSINLQQAQSNIEDADIAKESAEFTQAQIIQQAAVSILAQSNSRQQDVLRLLQSN